MGSVTPSENDERHGAGTTRRRVRGGHGTVAALLERRVRSRSTGKVCVSASSEEGSFRRPVPVAGRLLTLRRSIPPRVSNRMLAAQGWSAGDDGDPGRGSPQSGGSSSDAQFSGAETSEHATGQGSQRMERGGVDAWAWPGTVHDEREGISSGGPMVSGLDER